MWSETEDTISIVIPAILSLFIFFAELLLCYSILTSEKKLGNAYRRIIFVMMIFDSFISIGVIANPFRATPEISQSSIALGNHTSAVIFTAIMSFGTVGSQMYNVSLSVYYLYLIKYNYRERKFRTCREPYIHAVPILWALVGLISCLATQSFNPATNMYFITPYPRGCRSNDEIECTRGKAAPILALLFGTVTMFGTLVSNVVILLIIFKHVHTQEQKANRIRIRRVSLNIQRSIVSRHDRSQSTRSCNIPSERGTEDVRSGVLAEALAARNSKNSTSRQRSKIFLWRAFWYAAAFILCYGTNFVVQLIVIVGKNSATIPYSVRLWARIIRPLHGFFNILIFTYPHTKKKMKGEPELSYISALIKVIRSGCDNDDNESMSRRRRNGPNNSSNKESILGSRKSSINYSRRLNDNRPRTSSHNTLPTKKSRCISSSTQSQSNQKIKCNDIIEYELKPEEEEIINTITSSSISTDKNKKEHSADEEYSKSIEDEQDTEKYVNEQNEFVENVVNAGNGENLV